VGGRERLRLHPRTAAARGIEDGATVRVFNDRGQCLAGAQFDDRLREDVVELPTGAWFDPWTDERGETLELAGNPNVLTRDIGTSQLAQGPSAHTCLVRVEPYAGNAPAPRVYAPPTLLGP
ncbi:MAG: molybdopterin dinucleotide binding domain-containing protein, partial [Pseudomonadota bacterium]